MKGNKTERNVRDERAKFTQPVLNLRRATVRNPPREERNFYISPLPLPSSSSSSPPPARNNPSRLTCLLSFRVPGDPGPIIASNLSLRHHLRIPFPRIRREDSREPAAHRSFLSRDKSRTMRRPTSDRRRPFVRGGIIPIATASNRQTEDKDLNRVCTQTEGERETPPSTLRVFETRDFLTNELHAGRSLSRAGTPGVTCDPIVVPSSRRFYDGATPPVKSVANSPQEEI